MVRPIVRISCTTHAILTLFVTSPHNKQDPDLGGGCANDKARESKFQPITKVHLDGEDQLLYRALPIHVAIIRGTTADAQGNISIEQESLNVDVRICAAAARNSGGLVIAQVQRLAANNTLSSKSVVVPGSLVDCVVVVDEKDVDELHPMSFMERYNPALSGVIRSPADAIPKLPHDIRKLIARRAFFNLKPNTVSVYCFLCTDSIRLRREW